MSDSIDRRQNIIDVATHLFMQQSYGTTSMQAIADAIGCTKAALYYHFKGGKREILQAVIEDSMSYIDSVQKTVEAATLEAFIRQFMRHALMSGRESSERLSWIYSSFHQFNPSEKQLFQERELGFQRQLAARIANYMVDEIEAERLAWLLISATAGYAQIFWKLEMGDCVDYGPEAFIDHLARLGSRDG